MRPLSRTIVFLALCVATIMLAIFVIKAALALAFIVAAVFAALYIVNFARALIRRIAADKPLRMLRR